VTDANGGDYRPEQYWNDLVSGDAGLRNVAYPWLAESFNRCIYRAMTNAAFAALRRSGRDHLRGADVLDIGCGTGVWTGLWARLGAERVVGLDLSVAAVERLRNLQPEGEFGQGDIADAEPGVAGRFDLISAMSVLLHITDDSRFERALANIEKLLAPDGVLLIMDPVVVHKWWGRPFDAKSNSKARALAVWRETLQLNGLEVSGLLPVTCLLANPADTERRVSYRALSLSWRGIETLVGRRERVGKLVGTGVYHVDRALLRFVRTGPSTKILIVRRTGEGAV
jgi:SAM-dependent methyltransferase